MTEKEKQLLQLCHRFMEGQTSEAEEAQLQEYFDTTPVVPSELQEYAFLMGFTSRKELTFSEEEMNSFTGIPTGKPLFFKWLKPLAACAAVVLACAIAYLASSHFHPYKEAEQPSQVLASSEKQPSLQMDTLQLSCIEKSSQFLATEMTEPAKKRPTRSPLKRKAVQLQAEADTTITDFPMLILQPFESFPIAENTITGKIDDNWLDENLNLADINPEIAKGVQRLLALEEASKKQKEIDFILLNIFKNSYLNLQQINQFISKAPTFIYYTN